MFNHKTGEGFKNILIIVKRDPWFMETFEKYKMQFDMVYEFCFQPFNNTPFPYEKYQKILVNSPYLGYRKALKHLPKYKLAPRYSNIFIINTEKVRFESDLPKEITRMSYTFIHYDKTTREIPEMRYFLMKHRYWLRYLRRAVWNHYPINPDFMLLNGHGYRGIVRIFQYKKPYEEDTDLAKDIWLTNYFYNSQRGNITRKKILEDELKISYKI